MKLNIEGLNSKPKQPSLAGIPTAAKPKKLHVIKHENPDRTIRGSGITKRKAEQAERDQEKQQQEAYKYVHEHSEETAELLSLNLPTTLMDDSIQLDEDQIKAVEGLKNQKYGCLIGQAGVGKTTTIKALISSTLAQVEIINLNDARIISQKSDTKELNIAVAFVSFMGKSVQQIKRALPKEYHDLCGTIHSTLGYAPDFEEYTDANGELQTKKVFRPTFTALNKLPFKRVYVDEAGTVPVYLWNELIAALPEDCKIILMGDLNQLPPVSGKSILGYAIKAWPTFVLNKIHRNAGIIVENADRIIHGKKPLTDKADEKKFIVKDIPDSGFQSFQTTTGIIQALHKKGLFDPMRDAFVVPQNVDTLGQIAFNEKLVRYFNPTKTVDNLPINPPIVITAGFLHLTYAVGDKVMQLSNDRELGLTNGMIGVIKEIIPNSQFKGQAAAEAAMVNLNNSIGEIDLTNLADEIADQQNAVEEVEESERQASHTLTIEFQNVDELVEYSTAGQMRKITHSYAITCHKSQGGEYPTVVILCHSANLNMLSREWLYTAVTRAKERVILLTNRRGLTHAVNRQLIKGKTIEEKADKFILKSGNDEKELAKNPTLPAPVEI